ncbi:7432_t:CDS:1 [Scutellospora calospora]|uniref:7432_t:CDS:1 n=1 Tax=Scutellospora calospora TaxID=85575 RepID=A0ACA9LZZ6_9GLOM|nr:7432_t:CDS:1 [Scutellospora calospora]
MSSRSFDNMNFTELESLIDTNNRERLKFYIRELFTREKNLQNENTRLISTLNMNENKLENQNLEIHRKESYIIKLQTDISKMEHKYQTDITKIELKFQAETNILKTEINKFQGDNNLLKAEVELKNSLIQKEKDDNDNLKKYNIFLMDQIRYLQSHNNVLNRNEIKTENNFETYEGSSNEIDHFFFIFNNYENNGEYKSPEHD